MREDVLKIEFQPVFDKWAWKITYQNEDVLKRGIFVDEELCVESGKLPSFDLDILFLKGDFREEDDKINLCTIEEKTSIEEKVKAINEKYGIKKRWRANKYGYYHFLGNVFEICESIEMGFVEDIERYRDGNYFRTKEEAEEYRDYIVRKSLEWHEKSDNNE